jgi:hypothetical protein
MRLNNFRAAPDNRGVAEKSIRRYRVGMTLPALRNTEAVKRMFRATAR